MKKFLKEMNNVRKFKGIKEKALDIVTSSYYNNGNILFSFYNKIYN